MLHGLSKYRRTDPFFTDVVSLMHFDGPNGSTTFTDQIAANTWGTTGTDHISTTQFKFGGSSLSPNKGVNDSATLAIAGAIGSGDFTFECWIYPTQSTAEANIFSCNTGPIVGLYQHSGGSTLGYYESNSGGYKLSSTASMTVNAWNFVALTKSSGVVRIFVNGSTDGSTYMSSQALSSTMRITIGSQFNSAETFIGFIDEWRVTKIARYTSNFSVPTAPFPNS